MYKEVIVESGWKQGEVKESGGDQVRQLGEAPRMPGGREGKAAR